MVFYGHATRITPSSAPVGRGGHVINGIGWKNICKLWLEDRTPEQLKGEGG